MNLLILGGTMFVGRHLVAAARERGHVITLFNRGVSNTDLFPEIEKLRGDRNNDLTALQGRRWDAAIDISGYLPSHVRRSTKLLADAVQHYTFISSVATYLETSAPSVNENAPVVRLTEKQERALENLKELSSAIFEQKYRPLYAPLKVLCEQAAEREMAGRVLTIRAGLIVGPYDYKDEITYWVHRTCQGGEVLAPGRPNRPVQLIDARDLAEWIIQMVERGQTGAYNATGPDYVLTMQQFLKECIAASGSSAQLMWVSNQFLTDRAVMAGTELPLWHQDDAKITSLASFNCGKAVAAGLTFRPLVDTIRDTLAWHATRPPEELNRLGLQPARESQLLYAWRNENSSHQIA